MKSKTIHVLIFDGKQERLLTFNDELPHLNSSAEDTFSVAVKCLEEYVNASCCLMSRLYETDAEEVWQAQEVFLPSDEYWLTRNVNFKWKTIEEFGESRPSLEVEKWKKTIYRKNLAIQIAETIEKEHWKSLEQQLNEGGVNEIV